MPKNNAHLTRLEELKQQLRKRKAGHSKSLCATKTQVQSFAENLDVRIHRLAAKGVNISCKDGTVILGHPTGGILFEKKIPRPDRLEAEGADFFEVLLEAGTSRYLVRALESLGLQPQVNPNLPDVIEGIYKTRALQARLYMDSSDGTFTLVFDLFDGAFQLRRTPEFSTWPTANEIDRLLNEIDCDLTLLAKFAVYLSERKEDWGYFDNAISLNHHSILFRNANLLIRFPPYFQPAADWDRNTDIINIAREFIASQKTPPLATTSHPATMGSDVELA